MLDSLTVLGPNGLFEDAVTGFRARDIQLKLAEKVEQNINNGGVLVAESGTGTGKTYAYLVPALLSGKRVIVSTGTRHLQDQLFFRDLPEVRKVLGVSPDVALLKGRANYLCLWRLSELGNGPRGRYGKDLLQKRAILGDWAIQTQFGEISEVSEIDESDPMWRDVTSTSDNCLGGDCPDFKSCFVNKARQRALKAKLVVVNHHLFFSDVTLKEAGFGELLPGHDVVIFDEAHKIPDVASRFFGFTVSTWQLSELCRDIVVAEAKDKSGVLLDEAIDLTKKAIAETNLAFSGSSRGEGRDATNQPKTLHAINGLLDALAELETVLSAAAPKGEGLNRCHQRCLQSQGNLLEWMEKSVRQNEMVCWFESSGKNTRLQATPISIAKRMSAILENPNCAWIFTSATLAAGNDFSLFVDQLGMPAIETSQFDSPFDYANNALMYLPEQFPEPNNPAYPDAFVREVLPVLQASQGRAFLLFTSYGMMRQVRQRLEHVISWPMMMQGEAPRGELIDRFRESGNAVLLGTASFWEGVDIKGSDLSCVVIDKLPFVPPNDPVVQARIRQLQEKGENAFFDYQVPVAIITLKQGAGRLIRDEMDRGVLMLCDSRLRTKGYGKQFLASLPAMRRTSAVSDVESFFISSVESDA